MKKTRVEYFDAARAVCTLYIIGFWHLSDYVNISVHNLFTSNLTYGALGCFMFISAYFLGNCRIETISDVLDFYRRRFWKIYPLFFISCTSLLAAHFLIGLDYISSLAQYLLTLFGIVCFFPPFPATIWFISMLIMFYLTTPFLNFISNTKYKSVLLCVLWGLSLALKVFCPRIDERLVLLFPMYAMGLLMSSKLSKEKLTKKVFVVAVVVSAVILQYLQTQINSLVFLEFLIVIFGIGILQLGAFLSKNDWIMKVLAFVSNGSMVAYLFHRQYFGFIKWVTKASSLYVYIVALIILFIIAFYVQKLYENIVDNVKYDRRKKE